MKKIISILTLAFVLIVIACSSEDKGNTASSGSGDGFDRTALLTNWADNIIIPGYQNYQSKVQGLTAVANTFVADPSEANLQTLRTSWVDAYKAYQYISMYTFGKAQDIYFKEFTNTYPTTVSGIESNIASGTYNLASLSQISEQGLPALDYLINGLATDDASIIAFYSTNSKAANYKQYLTDVVGRLKTNVDLVLNDWTSGYRNTYVSSTGTATSSSVNVTTNCFVKYLDMDIHSGKVGIPAGLSSNGTTYPSKVEAFYKNDISKDLLNASIQAQQDFFNGKHFSDATNGPSLKSYLDYLNVVKNNQKLSDIINGQYATVFSVNANLSNSLSQQITNDNSKMVDSYNALQQLLVYLKLDMMQALKIQVDYIDNDGD